jgi:hypothetical protein
MFTAVTRPSIGAVSVAWASAVFAVARLAWAVATAASSEAIVASSAAATVFV